MYADYVGMSACRHSIIVNAKVIDERRGPSHIHSHSRSFLVLHAEYGVLRVVSRLLCTDGSPLGAPLG
jgi:hypothetical protein